MKKTAVLLAVLAGFAAACSVPADDAAPVQPAEGTAGTSASVPAKKTQPPIGLAATRATAKKSVLSDGGALTCVRVTVTNRTKKQLEINPLYFAITAADGTKHDASEALGDYEGQIDTMDLAPGERARGVVCVKGKFTAKTVSMTDTLLDTVARAEVS